MGLRNPLRSFCNRVPGKVLCQCLCRINRQLYCWPYILPNRLDSPTYLVFLRGILPELLENLPLGVRNNVWFQHDEAPANYGNLVRRHWNETFRDKWIERGGPFSWPPRSPDLTPLDFFLWRTIKQPVYATPVESDMDLVTAIIRADSTVFERVRRSMIDRFRLCNRVKGYHFEQFFKIN